MKIRDCAMIFSFLIFVAVWLLAFCLKHTLLGVALYRPLINSKAQIQPPPASILGVRLVCFVLMHQLEATVILIARLSRSKSAPGHKGTPAT